ncbi:ankyrin repeat protein [Cotonvirus japonicus]|uniref:Ankyrin repeat protein n=1 Tax=Cotonvirus japonicus TaxID=2811091 RepID=A0ABM7NR56_9VIRU|nr:ankyrin repeat protein [Cotonvirus japonicus]BCS82640.1 ankyrin repeat protein [Cotonvirus japonicus]
MTNIINDYGYNKIYNYCFNGECRFFTRLMHLIINERKIKNGHNVIVKYLKNRKNLKEINKKNEDGWSALMIAAVMCNKWSSFATVKLLIKLGADVNAKNYDETSILTLASFNSTIASSIKVVKLLLDHGANVNDQDSEGLTPLMLTCECTRKYSDIETVKLLLERGANINMKATYNGITALMLASKYASTNSTLKTVKLLLDYGADITIQDDILNTALMYACLNSKSKNGIETVKLLLDNGADIESKNIDGRNPLVFALININSTSSIDCVKLLLDYGANINSQCKINWTPLMYACSYISENNIEVIKLLLERGANVKLQNIYNQTCLMIACKYTKQNKSKIVELLLNEYNNVETTTRFGYTALMYVCKCKYFNSTNITEILETIELLLNRGANVNAQNKYEQTPLYLAWKFSESNNVREIFELLLKRGSDPNTIIFGKTIFRLYLERYFEQYDIIKLLLQYGADPNFNYRGIDCLEWVCKNVTNDKLKLLLLLLEYGAPLFFSSKFQKSETQKYKIHNESHDNNHFICANYLSDDEISICMKLIKTTEHSKNNMDIIVNTIPEIVPQYIYHTDSFNIQLINLKWNIHKYNSKQELSEHYQKYYDYFNAIDMDDFRNKINETSKYMY